MNARFALIPLVAVAGFGAYVAFHPGVAYAEPRMAVGRPTPLGKTASYTFDPDHTSVYFEITHLGLSKVTGRINKFAGRIIEDESDLTKSSVEFTGEIATIDTGVAPRDKHLCSADFFEVARYPTLTFKSTKVAKTKTGYTVTGDLTIKGTTRSVSIPFKHYGPYQIQGVPGQPPRIGIVADPITIKRSDFGVGSTKPLPDGTMGASDEVIVRISFEGLLEK
jgi:polyisoprenoid-binding protein YceI